MNARGIFRWIGLSAVAASLGFGAATAPTTQNAPDLTPLQQDMLLQLSDAEANIQAINKALKVTGYNVGLAYDKIESGQQGNDIMNREGGGPVRWDEFYGKTARDYPHYWDGRMDDHRPRQFAFVYKANNDQIARAKDQIASLQKDQQALLDRRQKHEDDESRLWAVLAWQQVQDREIEFRSLYRFALKPDGPDAAVLRPVILFLRNAQVVVHDGLNTIQNDQEATFKSGSERMSAAYVALERSMADALDPTNLKPDRITEGQALKALCKQTADECSVIADDYSNALERDKAKEDNSKLVFRGQLQSSLSNFATEVGKLDDDITQTASAWHITVDKNAPTTAPDEHLAAAVPVATPAPTATAQSTGDGSPSKKDFAGWYWIVNKGSGLYLSVTSKNKNRGNLAVVSPAATADNERWLLAPIEGFDGVHLVNKFSNRSIGVRNANPQAGADIIEWFEWKPTTPFDPRSAGNWKMESQGDFYKIVCQADGQCLTASSDNEKKVKQEPWNGSDLQLWQIEVAK